MAGKLRAEFWTLPTSATFEKVCDLPILAGSNGTRELSEWGDGTFRLPVSFDLSQVRPPDVVGLVRVFDDDKVVDEYVAARLVEPEDRSRFDLTGPQINGITEKLVIYPFNYPNDQPDAQDWIWGGTNILPDPTFADPRDVGRISEFWHEATSGQWEVEVDNDSVLIDYDADWLDVEQAYESLDSVTDVLVEGSGSEDDPYRVTFVDPPRPTGYSVNSGTLDEPLHATLIELGGEFPSGWQESQTIQTGVPIIFGDYDTFEVNTPPEPPPCGGAAVHIVATVDRPNSFPGLQTVPTVNSGGLYQPGGWVYPVGAPLEVRLVIRHVQEEPLIASSQWPTLTLPADQWSYVPIVDAQIPNGVSQVIWRLAAIAPVGTTVNFWVSCVEMNEGMAEATWTEIVRLLVEAGQARGSFEFLDLDFTDATDSAGNALDPLSYTAFAFKDFSQVLADGDNNDYKWRVVAKETPSNGFTHDLQVFYQGQVEDLTATDGGPTVRAGSIKDGTVVSRIPDFSVGVGWGAEGVRQEVADGGLVGGDMGRWERVFDAEHLASPAALTELANAKLREQTLNARALAATVRGDAQRVPFIDYGEGSVIWWEFAGKQPKVAKPVTRVSWTLTDSGVAEYELSGSRVFSGDAAMARAVDKLLREFKRRRVRQKSAGLLGGGGGMAHILIVSTSEPESVQRKADFVVPQEASASHLQAIFNGFDGGTVWMAGLFTLESDVSVLPWAWIRGLGGWFDGPGKLILDGGNGHRVSDLVFMGDTGIEIGTSFLTEISGCLFEVDSSGIVVTNGVDALLVHHNWFRDSDSPFFDGQGNWNAVTIISNNVGYGRGIVGVFGQEVTITDNRIFTGNIELAASVGRRVEVSGNDIVNGQIYLEGLQANASDGGLISNNHITGPPADEAGIHVHMWAHLDVLNNVVFNGDLGFRVSGTTDGVRFQGNRAREVTVGVDVADSTCVGTVVVGNMLSELVTTPIDDSGTSTVTTWPNDMTYGDNFV